MLARTAYRQMMSIQSHQKDAVNYMTATLDTVLYKCRTKKSLKRLHSGMDSWEEKGICVVLDALKLRHVQQM